MNSYTILAVLFIVFMVVSVGFIVAGLYYCFKSIQLANTRMPFGMSSLKVSLVSVEYLLVGVLLFVLGVLLLMIMVGGMVKLGLCGKRGGVM